MALELSYQICQQECCKQIQITDITYQYSADNLTGWGVPNDTRASVTAASLIITYSGVDYTIDITTEVQNDTVITITSSQVGQGADAEIVSGEYSFTITVTANGTDYTFDETKLFYCTEEKAFSKLLGEFNPNGCGCGCSEEEGLHNILDIWTYLMVLKDAACCGKTDKFTELLEIINRLLGDNPCSNC